MDIPAPWDVPERLGRLVGDLRSVGTRAEEDLRAFGARAQELQLQLASAVEVWREIAPWEVRT